MTPLEKRLTLFLLGCIPIRLLFVVAALLLPEDVLRALSLVALSAAIGFWVIFIGGLRKTGLETLGAPIWWNYLRPIHGTIWFFIAYYGWLKKREYVWKLMLLDVCFGLVSFTVYHTLL